MAGIDDRLRRKAIREQANRGDQGVPVAEGQIRAPDRAREEDVARKERAVGVVREMARRVAGDEHCLERDSGQLERFVAHEQDVRGVGPERQLGGREIIDPFERDPLRGGHVNGRTRRFGQVGHAPEVVPVPVGDQDSNAGGTESL